MPAALAFRAANTYLSGTPVSTMPIVVPASAVVGDFLFIFASVDGNAASFSSALSTPAGWTCVAQQNGAGYAFTESSILLFRKCQAGDAGSTVNVPLASGTDVPTGWCGAYANATGATYDVAASSSPPGVSGDYASASSPSVTTTAADDLVLTFVGYMNSARTNPTAAPPSAVRYNGGGGAVRISVSEFTQATAGATAGQTAAQSPNGAFALYTVALTPLLNHPPTAPTVTTPNGGETITGSSTPITWTAGTDPDSDPLTYDLDYSADGGGSWTPITTGVSGTSYTWTTSALPSGSNYLVRVRSNDGFGGVSAYDTSDAVFTIDLAPTAPTGLSPSGAATLNRAITQRFSWTFNDPNSGDSQSKIDLRYRVGTAAWTTVTQTTPNRYYDFSSSTFPAADYEWQIRTYDALGVVSPWSASAFFTAADAPGVPTITAPISGSTISSATGLLDWSVPSQESYQVRKVADDGSGSPDTGTVYYDSGEVVSGTIRSASLDFPTNGRYEHLQLRVKVAGLWSSWASVRVLVSYTPPAVPTVTITTYSAAAAIVVAWVDPAPSGSEPVVVSHDVWVRETANPATAERRAAGLSGSSWTDRTPASLTDYECQVAANGTNGTSSSSPWTGAATEIAGGPYGGGY